MKERVFKANQGDIPDILDYIRESLKQRQLASADVVKTVLAAEEILNKICEKANRGSDIRIQVGGRFSNVYVRYIAKGEEFTFADIQKKLILGDTDALPDETDDVMATLLKKLFGDHLTVRCEKGGIYVRQQVKESAYTNLIVTLAALVAGIIVGLLLQLYAPANITDFAVTNLFTPVYTVLINALKMVVAPLVFFSVASSIADFSDIRALGRIAIKIALMYVLTSMLAITVGFFTYQLMPIGNPELAQSVNAEAASATVAVGADTTISIKDTLVGIVPTDIVTPFQKSAMLQIIFMAVCLGLACAALSRKIPLAKEVVSAMNETFSKVTAGIVSFLPLMIFCSMADMMAKMKLASFMNVIAWLPVTHIGMIVMICVYMVLLLIFTRLNPFKFLSKFYPAMLAAFTSSSSNAAIPTSIRQCREMGISDKVYSFSLPLGATINMDGNCISLMITALFFAKIYEIPTTGTMLTQLFIAIIVLSVGSPGVPGGNLVCMTLLLPQIGVPAESVSLVMGLYPILSMIQTLTNVTGDAVVTTIAAKSEKMVNVALFNS